MQDFLGFEAFRGDVAALFDFQRSFASGGPGGAGAKDIDPRKRAPPVWPVRAPAARAQALDASARERRSSEATASVRQQFLAFGDAQNQKRQRRERRRVTLRVGKRDFLLARLEYENRRRERRRRSSWPVIATVSAPAARAMRNASMEAVVVPVCVITMTASLRAERDRVVHQLERLFEVRPESSTGEFAHPTFRHARRVQRSSDADESDALLLAPRHPRRVQFPRAAPARARSIPAVRESLRKCSTDEPCASQAFAFSPLALYWLRSSMWPLILAEQEPECLVTSRNTRWPA